VAKPGSELSRNQVVKDFDDPKPQIVGPQKALVQWPQAWNTEPFLK
jgi:hypothetical protein